MISRFETIRGDEILLERGGIASIDSAHLVEIQ